MEEVLILLSNCKTFPSIVWLNDIALSLLLLGSEHAALPKGRTQEFTACLFLVSHMLGYTVRKHVF